MNTGSVGSCNEVQVLIPLCAVIFDVTLNHGKQGQIKTLRFSVALWMAWTGASLLNMEELTHLLQDLTLKIRALIRVQRGWTTKATDDFVEYGPSDCNGRLVRNRKGFRPVCEMVFTFFIF